MALVTAPAVLLRRFPYGDTSQILRFSTGEMGVVGVVAKGVRARSSRGLGALEPFSEGALTVYHRPQRELQTFKEFQVVDAHRGLGLDVMRFGGASVLCELVLRHSGEDRNPELFQALREGLRRIENADGEAVLPTALACAWKMVGEMGYRPDLASCQSCGGTMEGGETGRFDFAAGGLVCRACSVRHEGPRVGPRARRQLEDLVNGRVPAGVERARAHVRLLSEFVVYHVSGGVPLRSLQVVADMAGEGRA